MVKLGARIIIYNAKICLSVCSLCHTLGILRVLTTTHTKDRLVYILEQFGDDNYEAASLVYVRFAAHCD